MRRKKFNKTNAKVTNDIIKFCKPVIYDVDMLTELCEALIKDAVSCIQRYVNNLHGMRAHYRELEHYRDCMEAVQWIKGEIDDGVTFFNAASFLGCEPSVLSKNILGRYEIIPPKSK